MDGWEWALAGYGVAVIITLMPAMKALMNGADLKPGGPSFDEAVGFSDEAKLRLSQNWQRIEGTLHFWKKRATTYTRFHYYCVVWTILSSWAVPLISVLAPADTPGARWLLTGISSHVALSLSFHRGLKISEGMKAFRLGESRFYDLYRRLLDRPESFGPHESAQLDAYFADVAIVRRAVRSAETESLPNVEEMQDGRSRDVAV